MMKIKVNHRDLVAISLALQDIETIVESNLDKEKILFYTNLISKILKENLDNQEQLGKEYVDSFMGSDC